MKSGLEIAQEAELRPITEIAASAGIPDDVLEPFGRYRAKVDLSILDRLADRPDGKLVITTAITPTKAGEGKTTTSLSLTQGMGKIGKDVAALPPRALDGTGVRHQGRRHGWRLRAGRPDGGHQPPLQRRLPRRHGRPQPARSALDASLYFGNPLGIDATSITWPRTLDVNARELRYTVIGLGGKMHGVPRENGFVITAASEVMAVLALVLRSRRPPRPSGTDRRRLDDGRASRSPPSSSRSPAR